MSLKDVYLEKMISRMGSAEYIVFLNGRPRSSGNSYLYAKVSRTLEKSTVQFYIKYKVEGRSYPQLNAKLEQSLFNDAVSGELFGFNFSNWLSLSNREDLCGVFVNESLKGLFLETPMYNLFRRVTRDRQNLNITFSPFLNEGRQLTTEELVTLLNRFRLNGFQSMVELEKSTLGRRIYMKTPRFYKKDNVFSLAGLRIDQVYNPLIDDRMLYEQLKNTKVGSKMYRKMIPNEQLALSTSFMSNHEFYESFGLSGLVPFNYEFFMRLMGGFVVPINELSIDFPSIGLPVFRLDVPTPDMPKVLSVTEYRNASERDKEYYVLSDSMKTYVLSHQNFFTSRGFRIITDLHDILAGATLL